MTPLLCHCPYLVRPMDCMNRNLDLHLLPILDLHLHNQTDSTPLQPDRIALSIPPRQRVIRPEPVVMQLRLLVEVLARTAQVELDLAFDRRGAGESFCCAGRLLIAEGGVGPLLHVSARLGSRAWIGSQRRACGMAAGFSKR